MSATATIVARATNYLELQSPYDYTPALAPGLAFTILFGVLTATHVVLAIKYKYWVALGALVPGGILEVLGWAGRLWSYYNVLNSDPFIMQICCLILGPAFFSAWAYTILGFCIASLGPAFSMLKPRAYLAVFMSADIVCLILQAIGGGGAAVKAMDGENPDSSTKIMLAGVLVQLGTMTAFSILAVDFIARVISRRPYAFRVKSLTRQGLPTGLELPTNGSTAHQHADSDNNDESGDNTPPEDIEMKAITPAAPGLTEAEAAQKLSRAKLLLIGTAFASAMIYMRGVYRSIELAQGWTGFLMTHEIYFIWLDGFPMVLAMAAFAVLHPAFLLPKRG